MCKNTKCMPLQQSLRKRATMLHYSTLLILYYYPPYVSFLHWHRFECIQWLSHIMCFPCSIQICKFRCSIYVTQATVNGTMRCSHEWWPTSWSYDFTQCSLVGRWVPNNKCAIFFCDVAWIPRPTPLLKYIYIYIQHSCRPSIWKLGSCLRADNGWM